MHQGQDVDETGGLCRGQFLNGPHMIGDEILFCLLKYRDFKEGTI